MFIPCTTCLHIILAHPCLYYNFFKSTVYCPAHFILLHILFFFIFILIIFIYRVILLNFLPLFMYILLCCVTYNCTVHWADLTNISLLIIFCIICDKYNLESYWILPIEHMQLCCICLKNAYSMCIYALVWMKIVHSCVEADAEERTVRAFDG